MLSLLQNRLSLFRVVRGLAEALCFCGVALVVVGLCACQSAPTPQKAALQANSPSRVFAAALAPDLDRLKGVPRAFLHQLRTQVKRLPAEEFPDEVALFTAFQRLRQAGAAGFTEDVINAATAGALVDELEAGRRFVGGEVYERFAARRAHVLTPAGQAQLGGFIEQVMQTPPLPERVALLKRLAVSSGLVERTVVVTWDATELWARLARAHLPPPLDREAGLTSQQRREQRAAFQARIQRAALVELDFIFQDLGENDLEAQLRFWASVEGQQTKDALHKALVDALREALQTTDAWLKAHPEPLPERVEAGAPRAE